AGTYAFTADFSPIGEMPAPALTDYDVLLQNRGSKAFIRTRLQDLSTGATDWTHIQNRPTKIDVLATLDTSQGAVEQTGANSFAKRTIGGGGPTSLVTYGDANLFYQPMNVRLSAIASAGVATGDIVNDAVTFAKMQNIGTARLLGRTTAGSGDAEEIAVGAGLTLSGGALTASAVASTGAVIQTLANAYSANTTLTTTIPVDDTTPTSSEGTEVCSQVINIASATNTVLLKFSGFVSSGTTQGVTATLFRGSTCINVFGVSVLSSSTQLLVIPATLDAPATTGNVTYSVRVGGQMGNVAMNGGIGSRYYGGVAKAVLVVQEIKG
ncbi:hypothetical protein AB4099_32840, partial [Bosea sp. 2KB_26]